ncbi:MAG: 5'-deoxynucleotidase [Christensenellales bacterium]|jgi:5'-deoxynucleotidase|uniref:5'-deoxynucleotidase n=1 Tax=Candidatus Avichristensenella intestinipullorum TaxID=2840693 RepID=A0A9D1CHZ8_9FIRM|nr:5'-deoxynucleotidase [Christensenellales bacterium]HIQ62270.1 5'-deoxynucleotidase [Candidatus Avichristensenella intestinipullorum]
MHHFFAYMARMRHIMRWGLMRNTLPENDQEHALQAAMIAHALATLRNVRYGGTLDAQRVALLAIYHDAGEVITGDLATPVKHHNPLVHEAFGRMEAMARRMLLEMLPEDLRPAYAPLLVPDETEEAWRVVKAADRICAYLKCVEEDKAGNTEFRKAREVIRRDIDALELPEVRDFMREFAPSFSLSLDELNGPAGSDARSAAENDAENGGNGANDGRPGRE